MGPAPYPCSLQAHATRPYTSTCQEATPLSIPLPTQCLPGFLHFGIPTPFQTQQLVLPGPQRQQGLHETDSRAGKCPTTGNQSLTDTQLQPQSADSHSARTPAYAAGAPCKTGAQGDCSHAQHVCFVQGVGPRASSWLRCRYKRPNLFIWRAHQRLHTSAGGACIQTPVTTPPKQQEPPDNALGGAVSPGECPPGMWPVTSQHQGQQSQHTTQAWPAATQPTKHQPLAP